MAVLDIIDRAATTAVRAAQAHDRQATPQTADGAESHAAVHASVPAAFTRSEPRGESEPRVDLAAVLSGGRDYVQRFWISPVPLWYSLCAVWAAHAWLTKPDGTLAWPNTGLLAFVSDEPLSGKSTGMELTLDLCPNPEIIYDPTAPAILEAINDRRAVVGLDEMDQTFGKGMAARAVRTTLNAGYHRGGKIGRVRGGGSPFSAKALASLAFSFMANPSLESTRTRSFIIYCEPPPAGVKPGKYREDLHKPIGQLAGEAIGTAVRQNAERILTAWPELPEHLNGRQEQVWEPLFKIAQVAGGEWPDLIWAACMQMTTGTSGDETPAVPPRDRLIADLLAVWPGDDEAPLADLAYELKGLPGAPWASMWNPVAMCLEIPAMLGIPPVPVVTGADGDRVQGYRRADVEALRDDTEGRR